MIRTRAGVTLIELLVVLAILSVAATMVVVTLRGASHPAGPDDADCVVAAKREAVASGRPVHVVLLNSGHARMVTAFPDGRVVGAHVALPVARRPADDDTR